MNIPVTCHISLLRRHHWLEYVPLFYLSLRKRCCQLDYDAPSFIKCVSILEQLICDNKMRVLDMSIIKPISESCWLQLNGVTVSHIQLQIHFTGYRNRETAPQKGRIRITIHSGLCSIHRAFQEVFFFFLFFFCSLCPLPDDRSGVKKGDAQGAAGSTLT